MQNANESAINKNTFSQHNALIKRKLRKQIRNIFLENNTFILIYSESYTLKWLRHKITPVS